MEKKRYFLDIAYMHPVCPLSLSHARIFVLADVWARWKRRQGYSVRFPICMHYSGSTVFKITDAVSKYLQKQKLESGERKVLDLLFNFYKVNSENLHKFTEPINVLGYFSDIILKDLKNIQVNCNYDDYFNTTNQFYQEFVRSIFDLYVEKGFTTKHNGNKALNYTNQSFRDSALKRLKATGFSTSTARTMVGESLEKLDDQWSYERDNSIGTNVDRHAIDPMFDAEFLSIFNAIYPRLKNTPLDSSNLREYFKELLYKLENQNRKTSAFVSELYELAQDTLPVDIFFVERHLQNWIAKRVYTETILLPHNLSTRKYFFLGSITKDGRVDSASRGYGMTLSQLIDMAGPDIARLALLLTFSTPHRDYEWGSTLEHTKIKLKKFNDFIDCLKSYSVEEHLLDIKSILHKKKKEIESFIERGNTRKILLIIFDELPKIIRPMLVNLSLGNGNKEILNFFSEYLDILCPSLNPKKYES